MARLEDKHNNANYMNLTTTIYRVPTVCIVLCSELFILILFIPQNNPVRVILILNEETNSIAIQLVYGTRHT